MAFLQVDLNDRDVGGRDTPDSACLTGNTWPQLQHAYCTSPRIAVNVPLQ
jgi:hypothetical protein